MTDQATKAPKREQGAGTFEFIRGHHYVRVSLPDDTRPRYRLCKKGECTCASMTDERRFETGAAIAERERARVALELSETTSPRVTVKQFGQQWTSGKLHDRWPDHVRSKRTSKQDGQRLALHVYEHVGDVEVARFRLEDAELVMRRLPADLTTATRRHVAQLMHRLMAMAVYPARLRPSNPLPEGFMPKLKRVKAFVYLYPAEDAALLKCEKIDAGERVFFGFLSREGLRAGEALALDWTRVDLKLGTIRLDENKTDDPRAWKLGDDTAEALRRWWVLSGSPKTGLVFRTLDGRGILNRHLAERFRKLLQDEVKLTRAELFESSKNRQAIRVHDLRATFVTLALATGRSETWVADRTGHRSSTMINRYRRAARTATELGLGWLAPLHETIPELAALKNVRTLTAG